MGECHANSTGLAKLLLAATNCHEAEDNIVKPKNFANYEIFKKSLESAPLAYICNFLDF